MTTDKRWVEGVLLLLGVSLEASVPPQGLELGSGDQEEQIITPIRLSLKSPVSPDRLAVALWSGAVPIE